MLEQSSGVIRLDPVKWDLSMKKKWTSWRAKEEGETSHEEQQ